MKIKQLKKLQTGQRGFTLLELLVVVTLLAVLATGALVAYDGAGDKAGASSAANTIGALDQGVRAYKAVTKKYPNQWDNLSNPVAVGPAVGTDFMPEGLRNVLGSATLASIINDTTMGVELEDYFENGFGMDEIQHIFGTGVGLNGPVEPNRAHNEGTNPPTPTGNGAVETEFGDFQTTGALATGTPQYISILAAKAYNDAGAPMDCQAHGVDISTAWTGNDNIPAAERPRVINSINDALSTERCNLVVAIGFGGDAAQSTVNSSAGVVQAPTYTSKNVNPATSYSRYVGLFLLAKGPKDGDDAGKLASDGTPYGAAVDAARAANLQRQDFLPRPVLLGFIDTEGKTIDANIANATRD